MGSKNLVQTKLRVAFRAYDFNEKLGTFVGRLRSENARKIARRNRSFLDRRIAYTIRASPQLNLRRQPKTARIALQDVRITVWGKIEFRNPAV